MLEEIRQQPDALERTLASELRRIERFKLRVTKRRPRLIVLAARGTSDNAAQFGRYLLEITTGIPVSLAAPAIHTLYNARLDYRDALVVAISQSGESTDTNQVLSRAREQGALTVGITKNGAITISRTTLRPTTGWSSNSASGMPSRMMMASTELLMSDAALRQMLPGAKCAAAIPV